MEAKLIVAGATGYLGTRLRARLPPQRLAGVVTRRPLADAATQQWLIAEGAIEPVAPVAGTRDLVLVNLIGSGRGHRSRDIYDGNVGAALMLVDFARKIGIRRIVHMSGFGVGPSTSSAYFQAKREAEEVIRGSGLEYAILRCSYILGGRDEFRSWILSETKTGAIGVPGSGDYRIQPLYVDDLVRCLIAFAEADGRLAETADFLGEPIGFADFLEKLLARLGLVAPIRHESVEALVKAAVKEADPTFSLDELGILLCDIVGEWTREVRGVRPRSAAEVIEAIAAEFGEHG